MSISQYTIIVQVGGKQSISSVQSTMLVDAMQPTSEAALLKIDASYKAQM